MARPQQATDRTTLTLPQQSKTTGASDLKMWEVIKLYSENVFLTVLIGALVLAGHIALKRSRPILEDAAAANKILRDTLEEVRAANAEYRAALDKARAELAGRTSFAQPEKDKPADDT